MIVVTVVALASVKSSSATPYEPRSSRPSGHAKYVTTTAKTDVHPGLPVLAVLSLVVALMAQNRRTSIK